MNYLNEMQTFQDNFLHKYLENNDYHEELTDFWIRFINIKNNRYKLKCALHIIAKISDNHFRSVNFWQKIENFILSVKENIINFFSEEEIFSVFMSNKKILLFLFQQKIIKPQYYMLLIFCFKKYKNKNMIHYLSNEFNNSYPKLLNDLSKKLCEDQHFSEKIQNGENPY